MASDSIHTDDFDEQDPNSNLIPSRSVSSDSEPVQTSVSPAIPLQNLRLVSPSHENQNSTPYLDESRLPVHLSLNLQDDETRYADENGSDNWIIKGNREEDETDRFARYLDTSDKWLCRRYRYYRKKSHELIGSSFAIFKIEQTANTETPFNVTLMLPPLRETGRSDSRRSDSQRSWTLFFRRQKPLNYSATLSSKLQEVVSSLESASKPYFQLILLAKNGSTKAMVFDTLVPNISIKIFVHVMKMTNFWTDLSLQELIGSSEYLPTRLVVDLPSEAPKSHTQASVFAWPAEEPRASLREIYIWQAYRRPPVFEEARLSIQRSDGLFKVLLLFNTDEGLATFVETYKNLFHAAQLNLTITDPVPQAHLNTLIFALHKHVMLRTQKFLKSTLYTLYYQDLAARDDPSRTKFLYISQLKDYSLRTQAEIRQSLSNLRASNLEDKGYITKPMVEQLEADGIYLQSKMDEVLQEIAQLSDQLVRYSGFKQAQHSLLLGIIIALFVPLSFVTSIFGMNTIEINDSNLPMALVWEIAIPLTAATILVPILFGRVLRVIVKSTKIMLLHARASTMDKALALLLAFSALFITVVGYLLAFLSIGLAFGGDYLAVVTDDLLAWSFATGCGGTFAIGLGASTIALRLFQISMSNPKLKLGWIFWAGVSGLAACVLVVQMVVGLSDLFSDSNSNSTPYMTLLPGVVFIMEVIGLCVISR